MLNQQNQPVVIAGGGFTGLFTALDLKRCRYPHPIILIDPNERFTFQPLLYEYFSQEMSTNQVCPRYEELLDGDGVTFVHDRVDAIDLHQRQVKLASGHDFTYRYLVLALGSVVSYFGIDGAKEHAWLFRDQHDAIALGNHLQDCLQQASQTDSLEERQRLLTVALMGGGPSGVELAATLGDLLPEWYSKLGGDPQDIRIVLLERGSSLLRGDINQSVRETAQDALQHRNVAIELKLEHTVEAVKPNCVRFTHNQQADSLPTATMVWTAGIATHPLMRSLPLSDHQQDSKGRPKVTPTLQLLGFPEVFAGGDCAAEQDEPFPPLAQVAYQQGKTIAHNLAALANGKPLATANVNLRGSLLKLGLGESAAQIFNHFEITGTAGHLIRQAIYLQLLPTPAHNLKASTEWIVDEVFQRHIPSTDAVNYSRQ